MKTIFIDFREKKDGKTRVAVILIFGEADRDADGVSKPPPLGEVAREARRKEFV